MAYDAILRNLAVIGEAVRALGLAVAVPRDLVLGHTCTAASFGALMRQELRWSRTIRSVDPAGYVGSVVTHPIPVATLAVLAAGFAPAALARSRESPGSVEAAAISTGRVGTPSLRSVPGVLPDSTESEAMSMMSSESWKADPTISPYAVSASSISRLAPPNRAP